MEDRKKLEKTDFLDCEIIAYECDDNKVALENPGFLRNQGSETRVCVELTQESKDEGLYLDRVLWFYFVRDDPREIKQWSIVEDSKQSPDELTEYRCLRGEDVCAFNTILRADFYAWQGVGIVRGIGLGLCMLGGGSWLVEDRKRTMGGDLTWVQQEEDLFGSANMLTISGFPLGTAVEYTDTKDNFVSSIVRYLTSNRNETIGNEKDYRCGDDRIYFLMKIFTKNTAKTSQKPINGNKEPN